MVRFRRNRSDGNTGKRNVSANGNMWLPSCDFPQRFYVFTLSFHLRILEISSCARVPLGPGKFHVVVLVLLVSSTGRFPIYFFGAVFIAWQWKLLKPGRAFPALSPVFENFCRFLRPDRPLLGLRGWPMGVSWCCGKFCWWLCLVPRLSQQKWYLPQCNCSNLHNMQDDRWQNIKG